MVSGSNRVSGGLWSSHVFERIVGKWIKISNMIHAGKPHHIARVKVHPSIDAIILDSDKTTTVEDKCISVASSNYPISFPVNFIAILNISFPENVCWNVSMRFMSTFNLSSFDDTFIDITLNRKDSEAKSIGHFHGQQKPYNRHMDFIQITPEQTLTVLFKTGDHNNSGQGFMLKLCKEECCFRDGVPSYWQEWGEWSYPNVCPYRVNIRNTDVAKMTRKCKFHCQCSTEDTRMKTGLSDGNLTKCTYDKVL